MLRKTEGSGQKIKSLFQQNEPEEELKDELEPVLSVTQLKKNKSSGPSKFTNQAEQLDDVLEPVFGPGCINNLSNQKGKSKFSGNNQGEQLEDALDPVLNPAHINKGVNNKGQSKFASMGEDMEDELEPKLRKESGDIKEKSTSKFGQANELDEDEDDDSENSNNVPETGGIAQSFED